MERMLLASGLKDRASFELIASYITLNKYSRPFQIVWDFIGNYYQRDANAQLVQPEVLLALIAETVRNDKHVAQFTELVADANATDVSDANVKNVVLEAKRQEVADELALRLTNNTGHRELLEEYQKLLDVTDLDELTEQGVEVLETANLEELLEKEQDPGERLVVYPKAINDRLDGGVAGGDHIIVYARPETGKTALCMSIAGGFARQGADGIYFGNEDRPQKLMLRLMSNLSGLTRHQIFENPNRARELALANGLDHIKIVSLAPGNPRQIEDFIEKYRPRWIVLDQLRNIEMKSDNRVIQLEMAANFARKMAKKYNIVVISVTQAGDSADGKEILGMGDVDFSNTGIPAQADVMIGMGVTPALDTRGERMISLPKNKLGGNHDHFIVRINQFLSRLLTVE